MADDGTVTGYDGTSHLPLLCDPTVDLAEHTANVYRVDVTARTLNRDKTILGTPTVVTCSNTFAAPALGGLTEVGKAKPCGDEKVTDSADVTAAVVDDSHIDEEAVEPECLVRLIRGLRLGTPIVNLTNRPIEVSGPLPLGNGLTAVMYVNCKKPPPKVG